MFAEGFTLAWEGVIQLCAVIVALGAAAKVPFVNRPGKWFIRILLIDPINDLMEKREQNIVSPVNLRLDDIEANFEGRLNTLGGSVDDVKGQVETIAREQVTIKYVQSEMDRRQLAMAKELFPNHGTSFRDEFREAAGKIHTVMETVVDSGNENGNSENEDDGDATGTVAPALPTQ